MIHGKVHLKNNNESDLPEQEVQNTVFVSMQWNTRGVDISDHLKSSNGCFRNLEQKELLWICNEMCIILDVKTLTGLTARLDIWSMFGQVLLPGCCLGVRILLKYGRAIKAFEITKIHNQTPPGNAVLFRLLSVLEKPSVWLALLCSWCHHWCSLVLLNVPYSIKSNNSHTHDWCACGPIWTSPSEV